MLQQQLEASNKEKTALKRRLEAATAALASANLNSANPTLLRVMQAGGKGGSQRGAGGTPHALALAWAREEAARLSPALTLVCLLAMTKFSIVVGLERTADAACKHSNAAFDMCLCRQSFSRCLFSSTPCSYMIEA